MGPKGSIEEYLSIRHMEREKAIEHMRFMILVKASLLDKESAEEVNTFNDLFKRLQELMDPKVLKHRKEFAEAAAESMDDMFKSFAQFKEGIEDGGREDSIFG